MKSSEKVPMCLFLGYPSGPDKVSFFNFNVKRFSDTASADGMDRTEEGAAPDGRPGPVLIPAPLRAVIFFTFLIKNDYIY
jgi:hypothetical protein